MERTLNTTYEATDVTDQGVLPIHIPTTGGTVVSPNLIAVLDESGGSEWDWGSSGYDSYFSADTYWLSNFNSPTATTPITSNPNPTTASDPGTPNVQSNEEIQVVVVTGQKEIPGYGGFWDPFDIPDNYLSDLGLEFNQQAPSPCNTGTAPANSISWNFVNQHEGVQVDHVYVPTQNGVPIEKSGATVSSGFDIGQHTVADMHTLGFPQYIINEFTPYAAYGPGQPRIGQAAVDAVTAHPLTSIPTSDLNIVDNAVHSHNIASLAPAFDKATGETGAFYSLPWQVQTAMADLQMSGTISKIAPSLWGELTTGQWDSAIANLNTWGSTSAGVNTRRHDEANLLKQALDLGSIQDGVIC